jgi:hypothetical protein
MMKLQAIDLLPVTVIFLGLISVSINVSEQQTMDMPLNNRSSTDDIQ